MNIHGLHFTTWGARWGALALVVPFLLGVWPARGQGVVKLYDQAVACPDIPVPGDGHSHFLLVSTNAPFMQSFVPALSQIGFVEVALRYWGLAKPSASETLAISLRPDSSISPIIASSLPLSFTYESRYEAFVVEFVFPDPVNITPGQKYFLEVAHLSGQDLMTAGEVPGSYPLGEFVILGRVAPGHALWFREGVVIPEPGTVGLLVLGTALLFCSARRGRSEAP